MSKKIKQEKVKVLYQNLNGVWYAFAETHDGVFFGRVPVKATVRDAKGTKGANKKSGATKAPSPIKEAA